jgi:hypothetical protein
VVKICLDGRVLPGHGEKSGERVKMSHCDFLYPQNCSTLVMNCGEAAAINSHTFPSG